MYCAKCSARNDNKNLRCSKCGHNIFKRGDEEIGNDPAMRMLMPIGRSGLAIAAGYAGLFAFLIIPAPIALVLGVLAIRDLRANPIKRGMGRAVFGTIVGALGTAVLAWMGISIATGT